MIERIHCTSCQGENRVTVALKNGGRGKCPQCGFEGELIKKPHENLYILYTPRKRNKLVFDLTAFDFEEDLTELNDSGVIPELEKTIAGYVGKKVEVIFKEVEG